MRPILKVALLFVFAAACNIRVSAQSINNCNDMVTGTLVTNVAAAFKDKDPNGHPNRPGAVNGMKSWKVYVCFFAAEAAKAKLLSEAEEKRQDKQPGATSKSSGSTSLVSKGSSPSLLGFALEHGGLTQTTSGNTITFRGNVMNSISALRKSTYVDSYDASQNDPLARYLSKLSFGVSFDTSSNQPSSTQGFEPSGNNFSGFSAKYEIYNHRDPRDIRWSPEWRKLSDTVARQANNSVFNFDTVVSMSTDPNLRTKYDQWNSAVVKDIQGLSDDPTTDDIQKVVDHAITLFNELFSSVAEVKKAGSTAAEAWAAEVDAKNITLANIRKTSIVTVEYNLTRQLESNNQSIVSTQTNQKIPDLSNINLVLEKGFKGANAPEFTFNAGGTWFNSPDTASPKRGRIRDFSASAELDVPLKEIQNVGQPTLSFSGQFLALVNEPLGQRVTINGVTVTRTGNMGVFQTKLSIPVKGSGVKIPISFTYASRTELVKEADVRGNVGITFDLDSLFSKTK